MAIQIGASKLVIFCVRKEAMDDSATMLGYPRLKAEVCRLETNMAPPRKIWDNRLVAWRVLLQSFAYVISIV